MAEKILLVIVFLISTFTLLWRIDGTALWRDEASTATIAREMVERKTLIPRLFNGEYLLAQRPDGRDFNDQFVEAITGWLQFYVAALGFLLAPPGTVSARLPFVVVGALSLWILYRVGGELFAGTVIRLAVPLAGATSIHFLSAARQSRYYVLVVLFTCCILWEFVRYLKEPAYAHRWGFYLRLGLWGALLYLSNYLSFGGLWASLAIFVLMTGDRTLVVRFFMTSAALAAALGFHFLLVHADFAKTVFGHAPAPWRNYFLGLLWHAKELFRMIPLMIVLPAAWYVFIKRKQRGPVAWMALLTTLIVIVSVIFIHVGTSTTGIARYYFQVVPAALLLVTILVERVSVLAGHWWAIVFFVVTLSWPSLNMYRCVPCFRDWSSHVIDRQLFNDKTNEEPMIEFLREYVGRNETVAFHRNVQGITAYFYLPWLHWTNVLDSNEPRNRRLRGRLPDYLFDDYPDVDWFVVWDNRNQMPRKLTADHQQLVWEYTYTQPLSWRDRRIAERRYRYQIYHRFAMPERRDKSS